MPTPNNTSTLPQTYDFQSDASGNWDFTLKNDIAPGPHVVTVEDEDGNVDQAIMYVIKNEKSYTSETGQGFGDLAVVDRITKIVPDFLFWPLLLLALILIITSFLMMRYAKIAEKHELRETLDKLSDKTNSIRLHHYLKHAVVISLVIFMATAGIGLWLNRETNFLSRFTDKNINTSVLVKEISGQVLRPYSMEGVAGVDLVSGNTTIHTGGSGHYIFSNLSTIDGMRLTFPSLLRPIIYSPDLMQNQDKLVQNIYFDQEMFNTLARVLDAEARGQFNDIYTKYTHSSIKEKYPADKYFVNYQTRQTAKNIADQEMVINDIKIIDNYSIAAYPINFTKAVVIKMKINNEQVEYAFELLESKWRLIK